jgi:N-acetylglucosaminyldiphosphoundecaprenol N-acetyl-beta-D-mannosaminyltransferase
MQGIERIQVLNVPVDVLTMEKAVECACQLAKDHSATSSIVAVNPEKSFAMRQSEEIREFIENADLVIPDGIGIVFGAKILLGRKMERVPGADLMQEICRVSGKRNVNIFIYGAKEEVNAGAVEKLRKRHPDIQIVGRRNGYVKDNEMEELIHEINTSKADIVFLALGSPRQERWMNIYGSQLNVGACMGIGGTLDTITGTVKRATKWIQKIHLEWLDRFIKQPSRFRRTLVKLHFAGRVLWGKVFRIFRR